MKGPASFSAKVTRGEKSWNFIYTFLGFSLTIETGVMGLIQPIKWPWNVVTLAVVAAGTIYLFLESGWFQNKLLGWKAHYENKSR